MPPAVRTIAVKDLRLRMRDRSVLITGILAPLILAFIFNGVFGGSLDGSGFDPTYTVVDLDDTDVSRAFVDLVHDLEADGVFNLVEAQGTEAAETLLDAGDVASAWIIPDGFGAAVSSGQPTRSPMSHPARLEVIGSVDAPVATRVAQAIASRYALGVEQVGLRVAAGVSLGAADQQRLVDAAIALPAPVELGEIAASSRRLVGPTAIMAGMAVFFLFFTVQFGVTSLLEEQREGTYPRLLAAPIGRWAPIAAKALGGFALGLISMTVLMAASSVLMGAEWGPIVPVAVLVVAGVASAVGVMGIVAAFATSPESAGNVQTIVGVVLGILGGSFFPVGQDGGILATLQYLTPHAWFMRGLGDLAGEGSLSSVLPATVAMLVFGLVTGGAAWFVLRRKAMQ